MVIHNLNYVINYVAFDAHIRLYYILSAGYFVIKWPVADRWVSGPWGPQFCGALCNGETKRLPTGGAGSPPAGPGVEPWRQTHFGNNILKTG